MLGRTKRRILHFEYYEVSTPVANAPNDLVREAAAAQPQAFHDVFLSLHEAGGKQSSCCCGVEHILIRHCSVDCELPITIDAVNHSSEQNQRRGCAW